ncbi:MAG: MBL fold metallo-hydrolase [Actinomycetota bacterium]|nr:MBL fold metallo-hydrolase [Actinomycetota bacterium]
MTEPIRVTDRASFVLADNPGFMTLDGTNSWILREPGASQSVVVDPGPLDEQHLQAVLAAAGNVGLVLVTHRHFDHTDGVARFAELSGAPARAVDPQYCVDADVLVDGEQIVVDGLTIDVLTTPGHTADSTCFRLVDENTLLSGDTILGRGTTVVAHPDGALGPYLDSLALIGELAEEGLVERILPGHGPVITDPGAVVNGYLDHRAERLDQVLAAVEGGATTAREVVELVYQDVDQALWPAAELSVAAQLDYLREA